MPVTFTPVPVTATAVTDRHMLLIDGWPANVRFITYTDDGIVFEWYMDPDREGRYRTGELEAREDELVECARWAEWAAARLAPTAVPADPWDMP